MPRSPVADRGARMRLRVVEGPEAGRAIPVGPEGVRIGRGAGNDLSLADEGVSRQHCRVCLRAGAWLVEDLNSTNGVTVNGRRIAGACALFPGDRIGVGRRVLVLERDPGPDGAHAGEGAAGKGGAGRPRGDGS